MFEFILKQLKSKKGFTLVELVVVIAILGILAAIAVPKLSGFGDSAKRARVEAEHRQLISAIQMWQSNQSDKDAWPDSIEDLIGYFNVKDGETLESTLANNKSGASAHVLDTENKTLTSTWESGVEWVYKQ